MLESLYLKIVESEDGRKSIIRTDTGAVLIDLFLDGVELQDIDSIKIITKREKQIEIEKSEEALRNKIDMRNHMSHFGKLNIEAEEKLARSNLTATEIKLCLMLRSKVSFRNGKVRKDKRKLMQPSDLSKILDVCGKTADKSIKRLIKEEIIKIVPDGKKHIIYFNPYLLYKGSYVEKELFEMFENSKWKNGGKDERD